MIRESGAQMEDLVEDLADTATHLLANYVRHQGSKPLQAWYASLLKHLCRELEDFAPRNVSKAACDEALRNDIADLREFHWNDQHKFDKGREVFQWEHMVPASDLFWDLVALAKDAKHTEHERVAKVLRRARIAWILKDEDKGLPKNRRADPWRAYQDAKIELVYRTCGVCSREDGEYECSIHGDRWPPTTSAY